MLFKARTSQKSMSSCIRLVYFKTLVGLKLLLIVYLMNQVYMVKKKVNGNWDIFKANHLVYIVPRRFKSQIYTDCKQKLFSSEDDTGGRILQVTFLVEQIREYARRRGFDTELVFIC